MTIFEYPCQNHFVLKNKILSWFNVISMGISSFYLKSAENNVIKKLGLQAA